MSLSFPATPTLNQIYQGWIWNGNAWDPNFGAKFVTSINGKSGALGPSDVPGVGNRVLLSSQIVIPSAPAPQVTFVYNFATSPYEQFDIEVYDAQAAAAGNFAIQYSFDGSTFLADANYYYASVYGLSTSNAPGGGGTQVGTYLAAGSIFTGGMLMEARYRLTMPGTTDRNKVLAGISVGYGGSGLIVTHFGGTYAGASQYQSLRGLRFATSSGNITRGVFNVYGIVTANSAG